MQPAPAESGAGGAVIACGFCGTREILPHDATLRVRALEERLRRIASSRAVLTGLDRSVAGALESGAWLRGTLKAAIGPLALVLVLVLVPGVYRALDAPIGDAAERTRVELQLANGLWMLSQLGVILLGMATAYFAVAHRYRARVRPQLLARPAEHQGAAGRCRVCGGDLAHAPGAFTECRYCGATNLVGPELFHQRQQLLERELSEYRTRAAHGAALIGQHTRLMSGGIFGATIAALVVSFLALRPLAFLVAPWLLAALSG